VTAPGRYSFLSISSTLIVALFLVLLLTIPEFASNLQSYPHAFVARYFSEYLVWTVTIIAVVTLALAATPFGKVTLGEDGEKPEFNRFSWFAMLFSAGVGTGILF
jgi:choline-glycine betaine transporter